MTGLAFTPPDMDYEILDELGIDETEELVADLLDELGIHEEFFLFPGRTIEELQGGFAVWMWDHC